MLYNNMYQLHYDSLKNTQCKYLLSALPITADKENLLHFSLNQHLNLFEVKQTLKSQSDYPNIFTNKINKYILTSRNN